MMLGGRDAACPTVSPGPDPIHLVPFPREPGAGRTGDQRADVLDALPAQVALLDHAGVIFAVNRAWKHFAAENDFAGSAFGIGSNYLAVCEGARGAGATEAAAVATGLRAVLSGAREELAIEYPCHSPDTRRWFRLTATPMQMPGGLGALVMHVDVTDRQRTEEALQFHADFERLICNLSTRFINCRSDEMDAEIDEALRRVGELVGVDRLYVLLMSEEGATADYAYEWCAAGTFPLKGAVPAGISTAAYPWTMERCRRFETIHIPRVADLPPEAAAEKAFSEAAAALSCVLVPMSFGGTLAGLVGYASVRGEKTWPEESLALLRVVGDMLSNAIARKRVEAELRTRAQQQQAVAELGHWMLSSREIGGVFERAAALAARVLGVDFSVIVELLPDGQTLQSRAGIGWGEGLVGQIGVGSGTRSHAGYVLETGEPVVIDDLGSETRFGASRVLHEHGVVSGAGVLIQRQERPFGALCVYHRGRRDFSRDDLHFIQAIANLVAAAVEGQRAEKLESHLATIVESSADAIIGKTLTGTIVSWNLGAERLYGYSAAEAVGQPLSMIVPVELRSEMEEILARVKVGRRVEHLETVRVHRTGRRVDVSLTVSPIRDAEGRITAASASAQDISEAKRAATALALYAERMKTLREIDRAILAVDSPAQIAGAAIARLRQLLACERVAVTVFDLAADEMTLLAIDDAAASGVVPGATMRLRDFTDPDRLRQGADVIGDLRLVEPRSQWAEAMVHTGLRSLVRVPLLAQGALIGSLNLAASTANAFTGEHLEIAREVADQLAVAIRQADFHEQVQRHATELEVRVSERTTQLEAVNRELESFSYSVSHDLRAPLRAIKGFAGMLAENQSDELGEAGRHNVERIRTAVLRMSDLIDGMLSLGRIARSELRRGVVDLSEMALAIAAELREQGGREVEFVIAPGLRVQGDGRLLRIALQNLLSNAWKYTSKHQRARIELGCTEENGCTVYFVRDDGAGFDMTYAGKLFTAFQRLHRPCDFEGTGIGLATVHRIIDRHGGRIWADAAPERGATFRFTLGPTESIR